MVVQAALSGEVIYTSDVLLQSLDRRRKKKIVAFEAPGWERFCWLCSFAFSRASLVSDNACLLETQKIYVVRPLPTLQSAER